MCDAVMIDAGAADRIDQHEGELAGETARLELLDHPHQRHADTLGTRVAQAPQQLRPAEREEPPVEVGDQLVDVGQRDHEGHRLAVELGDADQILVNNRLQLLAGVSDLGVGQGDEPPIVRPGVVEDVEDDLGFAVEMRLVDVAQADPRVFLAILDQAADEWLEFLGDVQFGGVEILGLGVAGGLDPCAIGRAVMGHHHYRRLVEARNQQARLVPDRYRDGTQRTLHAFAA